MTFGRTKYHSKLTDRASIATAVKEINEKINGCGFDFREDTHGRWPSVAYRNISEPGILIILSSFDFFYYHDLEIVFYDVSYTNIPSKADWWDHWTKDQLELSPEDFPEGFEFRFNIGTNTDKQYTVRSKAFSYLFEHVSYK
jgi:hypothetical protein